MPQIIVSMMFIAIVVAAGWLIVVTNNMVEKKAEADIALEHIVQQLLIKTDVVSIIYENVAKHDNQEDLLLQIFEVKANLVSTHSVDNVMKSAHELKKLQNKTINNSLQNPEVTVTEEYMKRIDKLKKIEKDLVKLLQQYNYAVNQQRNFIRTFPNNVASVIIGVKKPKLIRNEDIINSIQ